MIGTRIPPVDMAREAVAAMTEAQRMAFAIELVNGATERSSALHLRRLERLALDCRCLLESTDCDAREHG